MAREFYSSTTTALSRHVLETLKARSSTWGRVTLLGGWAVYELVDPPHAMESQDIDLLIQDTATWGPVVRALEEKGYVWRFPKKQQRDQRLEQPDNPDVGVDLFYANAVDPDLLRSLFGLRWAANFKDLPYEGFVPSVSTLLVDKLHALPLRHDSRTTFKRLKDALDIHALFFHNSGHLPAAQLLSPSVRSAAEQAAESLASLDHPEFRLEIGELRKLLRV